MSAAAGAHFANPRNDFWRLLHAAKLTPRLYAPQEQFALLEEGIGVTNAAYRTTPGSGDLRRADFVDSAERLDDIARELRPEWLAFVGKEAYRGAFGARPDLGLQVRTLGETRFFVLPSTSPANAAVPWDERLRWFRELAGRASGLPRRESVRAAVIDERGRALLLRYGDEYGNWWVTPGGGREEGEDDEQAMHRNAFVRAAYEFGDETLDYALVDSAPRGCLCRGVAPKIRRGGVLILDNANWYLPPPASVHPPAPGSVSSIVGTPGSRIPNHECWPAFARLTADWAAHWSSNGIQMTLILVKP